MTARTAALSLFVISLLATAAEARCPTGQAGSGGMCMPCGSEQYVAGNACRTCPEGFTTTSARTGCKKAPAVNSACTAPGYAKQGGMCMPCGEQQAVIGGACKTCPAGFSPTSARNGCKKEAAAPQNTSCTRQRGYVMQGGMCQPCAAEHYVAGGQCRECPAGFITTSTRTGCKRR